MDTRTQEIGYVWGLDIIRFFAALSVVIFHLSWQQSDPQIRFDPGWVGVEIFFVISGFVIMGSAGKASPVEFIESRFARLYPAAISCALISFAVLQPLAWVAQEQNLHVMAGLRALGNSVLLLNGPFMVSALWTLPIELGFYVAVLILMIAGRVNRGNLLAGLLILWSGLYLIPFALTEYGIGHLNVKPLGYGSLNVSLLRHGCFFGVGMMIWQVLNKRPRSIDLAILVGGIIICWVEIIARSAELSSHYSNPISLWLLVSGTLATFTSASFLIWWLGKVNNQVKIHRTAKIVLRRLGLMTYPLYLMHESVGGVTYGLLMGSGHGQGLSLIAGLLISLVASLLVVEVIEPSLRRCLLKVVHPLLIWLTTNNVIASLIGTFKPKIKPTKSPEYTIGGV